jgi:hypothetical protein
MNTHEYVTPSVEDLDDVRLFSEATRQKTDAAAQSDDRLKPERLNWLRGVLGIANGPDRRLTNREFTERRKCEVPMMIPIIGNIAQAANYEPSREELYRYRMYLNGDDDRAIGGAFRKPLLVVSQERVDLIDRLNGEGEFTLTGESRSRIAEARKQAIGQILGSAALEKVVGRHKRRNVVLGVSAGSLEPTWEHHELSFIVARMEQAMERKGVLTPGLGLLQQHFLDTQRDMGNALRTEISPALRSLSSIVKNEIIAAADHDEPIELYKGLGDALDFLRSFVDHTDNAFPRSRNTYMQRWKAVSSVSDKTLAEKIQADNRKLAFALSWVFDTTRKQSW